MATPDRTGPNPTGPDQIRPNRRLRRSTLVTVALVGTVIAVGLLFTFEKFRSSESVVDVATTPVTSSVTSPPLPPALVVTPQPSLPLPDPLPADPRAPTDDVVIGHLEIPKIGVDEDIHRGITLTSIDRGPGWWPGTAMPGELGNVVIAGHRVTHSRPFNRLDELVAGDQVAFTTDAGRFTYEVRGVIVVPADWIDIATQDDAHTATLFACHPKGAATHRVVAKLRLLDADGTPSDPEDKLPAINAEELRSDHTLLVRQTEDGGGATSDHGPLVGVDG